jgi:methylenetetrahydrofolate dehydrogenase (NADP+) / methenyltetrahydrofolate cyclohydrolase
LADRHPDTIAVLHPRAPSLGASLLANSSDAQEHRVVADVIDGKAMAAAVRARVSDEVRELESRHRIVPGLAVVLVGSDPASEIYTGSKKKMAAQVGIRSFAEHLPASTTEAELIELIERLNGNHDVHGILVQLPLPAHIDPLKVIAAIDPAKDVDGFHPLNVGLLAIGQPALTPCTPLACIMLAKSIHPSLAGLEAMVIGRSAIVGKPLAQLLLAENATVTVAHSKSSDLPALARRADLVFAAVGRPEFVRKDWVKPGATVIDVGINRIIREGKPQIVGDVAFEEACGVAGAITPVPGGVGPMTIACLLVNTLRAAGAISALPSPPL